MNFDRRDEDACTESIPVMSCGLELVRTGVVPIYSNGFAALAHAGTVGSVSVKDVSGVMVLFPRVIVPFCIFASVMP